MADTAALRATLTDGDLQLVPFGEAHREPLRAACAEDREIWAIYPISMLGGHFDPAIAARLASGDIFFAVLHAGGVVGCTTYLSPDGANGVVEIGGTYIAPRMRGTGLNCRMKRLLIDHAFACGFHRIQFKVDERNARSRAAVLKLGAQFEGMLRGDRVTWTGFRRNTCVFGLLPEDWQK